VSERVLVEVQSGVAHVRLNRPEKLNAFDAAMFEAILAAGERVRDEPRARAVVLSGEGRAFSAGLDFASFLQMAGGAGDPQAHPLWRRVPGSPANHAQRAAWIWTEVPVPVIAAVQGFAFGAGLQVALGADLRLVAPDAELSIMELRWGLVPDMAGTQLLRRVARLDVVKELTFTARRVRGAEAVALGLATRVSERPLEDALALAREIAGRSPDAVRAAKRLLDASHALGVAEGLAAEEHEQRALVGSPNQIEAVQANLEKREPRFRDPD
jgi:enoyl-CoA hydratase/carnithine racemase